MLNFDYLLLINRFLGSRLFPILGLTLITYLIIWQSQLLAIYLLRIRRSSDRMLDSNSRTVSLLSGLIRMLTYVGLLLALLSLFVELSSLLWFVGLFSAGFGIGARPIIADYLTGIILIFDDSLEVGEKIEFPGVLGVNVEGTVEAVNLRTTTIRALSGEPFIVPNGEIRVIRNFSRAKFSEIKVHFRVKSAEADKAIEILEQLSTESVSLLENLIEPWTVLSDDGQMGATTVLKVVAHANFGTGAIIRPRILVLVQKRLSAVGIQLEG